MSISNAEVEAILKQHFSGDSVQCEGDGYKYTVTVISEAFAGKGLLQRHQAVNAALSEVITSGDLHALTIKAKTPEEVA